MIGAVIWSSIWRSATRDRWSTLLTAAVFATRTANIKQLLAKAA